MKQFLLDVWTQQQPPASAETGVSIERPQHSGELQTYRGDTWYNIYFTHFSLKVSKPCITFSAVLLCSACLSKNKVVYLFEIMFLSAIWLFHNVTGLTHTAPSAEKTAGPSHCVCWPQSNLDVQLTVHFSHFLFFYTGQISLSSHNFTVYSLQTWYRVETRQTHARQWWFHKSE